MSLTPLILRGLKQMPKTDRKEYSRQYRLSNKDRLRLQDKARRPQQNILRRIRNNGGKIPKCAFCGILLTSKLVKRKHSKYCDTCKKDPGVIRHIRALYMARWYAKKKGNEQPSLIHSEDIIA